VRRGEIWWARLPAPAGKRPVLLLSRDEAYSVRALITVAPITTRVRGLPVEIPVGSGEGLPKPSVVNLDTITTIAKRSLEERAGRLAGEKLAQLDDALRFALGLD
jgi:mRNA interferase MazF